MIGRPGAVLVAHRVLRLCHGDGLRTSHARGAASHQVLPSCPHAGQLRNDAFCDGWVQPADRRQCPGVYGYRRRAGATALIERREGSDHRGGGAVSGRSDLVSDDGRDPSAIRGHWPRNSLRRGVEDHRPAASSSFANFARNVFCPTELKRTTSLVSSLSGSTLTIVPTPNCAWRTLSPGLRPVGSD